MCLHLFIFLHIQFIQGFLRTLTVSEQHLLSRPFAYPHLYCYFCPLGFFTIFSEIDKDLLFLSWETFTVFLLLSDWNLSSAHGYSRSPRGPWSNALISRSRSSASYLQSQVITHPSPRCPPLPIDGVTLLYLRQTHFVCLAFVPSSFFFLILFYF